MKKIISLIIIIVILGIIAVALKSAAESMRQAQTVPMPTDLPGTSTSTITSGGKVSGAPTNFAHEGVLSFLPANPPTYGVTLSYMEGNTREASTTLLFDELSACAAPNGSQPCIEFNVPLDVPYNGKTVIVEGIRQPSGVLVRKMMIQAPGDHPHIPVLGRVFVSWQQAIGFINSCAPAMIVQTHDLDVNLRMKDGTTLVAVEPVIDEVMRVAEAARATCGVIPIATE